MMRLFRCTVSLIYEGERGDASVSSLVADSTEFWWNERKPDERTLWESKIELGEKFFQEIIRHPVPLDMNILKALKRSPLGLDLYLWVTYRTFSLQRPLQLSWKQLYRQFGVDPAKAGDNRTVQAFRCKVLRELKKIKLAWTDLNYSMAKGRADPLALEARHPAPSTRGIAAFPFLAARIAPDGAIPEGSSRVSKTLKSAPRVSCYDVFPQAPVILGSFPR